MSRLAVLLLLVAACGTSDDGGGGDDGGGSAVVTCTVQATATLDPQARTVTAVGSLACDGTGTLMVETCIETVGSGGEITELGCHASTLSGVDELASDYATACGIASGREYYAQINATVNGVAQAEKLSARVVCN